MSAPKMHENEVLTDEALVRRLLAEQFPQWAELPLKRVPSDGTDNALYRLGDDMVVRLPRIDWAIDQVEKEQRWLPRLAPHLPLDIPVPLAMGMPGGDYPWHWSVYRWLEGENATPGRVSDLRQAARDLAQFIADLQSIDPTGGPRSGSHNVSRGVPLVERDAFVRESIKALRGTIDTGAATEAWEVSLNAPVWQAPPVWIHGDLQAGNLLVQDGRLSAVIDFGCLAVGDPACDVMIAWGLFTGESRRAFRDALGVDDATWLRGRGWALSQALGFIPYYRDTNPIGVATARRVIDEVLAEHNSGE